MGFALKQQGVAKEERSERVSETARILDLTPYLDRKPKHLSGGQRQRVAMGRAIVRDPKVFLFDEPLSNLDAKLRVAMRAEIKALHQRLKTTTVYVTHDQVEAMTMADRIAVMNDGRVEQIGAPLELYDRPANLFVAQFIGSPSMNVIDGVLRNEAGSSWVEGLGQSWIFGSASGGADGQHVKYGIRPEHIAIDAAGIPAEVMVVEPMGSETELVVKVEDSTLVVLAHGRAVARPGDRIFLNPDPQHAHVFDAASGRRI
jgi:multiple sugar transport system ATP-binding protein